MPPLAIASLSHSFPETAFAMPINRQCLNPGCRAWARIRCTCAELSPGSLKEKPYDNKFAHRKTASVKRRSTGKRCRARQVPIKKDDVPIKREMDDEPFASSSADVFADVSIKEEDDVLINKEKFPSSDSGNVFADVLIKKETFPSSDSAMFGYYTLKSLLRTNIRLHGEVRRLEEEREQLHSELQQARECILEEQKEKNRMHSELWSLRNTLADERAAALRHERKIRAILND